MQLLTDLEAAVLGLLWRAGGDTAYAVRKHLALSPSTRFSGSTGAVYPLIRRLARQHLVAGHGVRAGQRRATVWTCTPAGLAALRAWIEVPGSPADVVTADPLRTRWIFLELLPAAARSSWLDSAEEALRVHRALIESLRADEADVFVALAHRNALLQADARLAWIGEARAALERER